MARGNWSATNRAPSLKQRLRQRKDYNRRLAAEDAKNRCANPHCKQSLVGLRETFCIAADPLQRKYCRALCVPTEAV
jgi:hypothetical protein